MENRRKAYWFRYAFLFKIFADFIDISCVFYYIKTTKFQRKNTGQVLTLGLDREKR